MKAQAHLDVAVKARSYYKGQIDDAKASIEATFTVDGTLTIPPVDACLRPMSHAQLKVHFSFDIAQQVRYNLKTCTWLNLTLYVGALSL